MYAFAPPVRVLRIGTHVVFKLPAKAVLLHADGDGARHPEGVSQPRVAALRQVRRAAKLPRLFGAEIEAAVLQKLARTAKAAEVTRFGQDDHRENRPDAREGLQPDEIRLVRQARRRCPPRARLRSWQSARYSSSTTRNMRMASDVAATPAAPRCGTRSHRSRRATGALSTLRPAICARAAATNAAFV